MLVFPTVTATFCVVVAFYTASISAESDISAAVLPHPSCTYSGNDLECTAGNYSIPFRLEDQGSFNLSLIPDNVMFIRLGQRGRSLVSTMEMRFPNLTGLRVLELHNFGGYGGDTLSLDYLLSNVKATLRSIRLRDCRVGSLGANFLKDYYALRTLDLAENDIASINHFAFGSFSGRSFPLETIDLQKNKISSLLWETFAPVAQTLRTLRLNDQKVAGPSTIVGPHNITGMTSIISMGITYKFQALETLDLSGNALDFPWPGILRTTLNVSTIASIKLDYNAFCPNDPAKICGCCAAAAFMRWVHEVASMADERKPVVSFTCGRFGYGESPAFWAVNYPSRPLPALAAYSGCCVNEGDLGCTTTTRRSEWGVNGAVTWRGDIGGSTIIVLITLFLLNV
ncbi:uncharacterized protein LOC129594889 [Paramacrobiotus metropolitanus]|uniref:uncharacterized protein LOC129594889 n=1 Tax=Paramacrobiotus metropolitanus TaxID=2943436 RepID=UPI002445B7EB|nr:uncharacterized protein LOC129594889 [Paramacrobiotus metropolitanus]